jgi:hypothetical protein
MCCDPNQSVYLVPEHIFQNGPRDCIQNCDNFEKKCLFRRIWIFLQIIFQIFEKIKIVWCQIRRVRKICGDSERTWATRYLMLPRPIEPGIVYMNDKKTSARFCTQSKNWFQNMFDIMYYIRYFFFWKKIDSVQPEKIPCYCEHHFMAWIICFSFLRMIHHPAIR